MLAFARFGIASCVTPAATAHSTELPTRRLGQRVLTPVGAFVVCAGVLLIRSLPRLEAPHLWAEDGTDFLPDALTGGWSTPFKQLWGSFHFLPRLVAQLAVLFPVRAFPALAMTAWIILFALAASLIVRAEYRELIRSDGARFGVAIAFGFLPGLNEMLGTLCNLHWVSSMALWIIAMKPASRPLSRWEAAFVPIAALSGGETIVLIPIFAWRAWTRRREPGAWRLDAWAAIVLLLAAVLNYFQKSAQPPVDPVQAGAVLSALRHSVLNYFVYQAFIGPLGTSWLGNHTNANFFALWGGLALLLAVVVLLRRGRLHLHLAIGVASWASVLLLKMLVRPGAVEWFDVQHSNLGHFMCRYAFDLALPALVFWVVLLQPIDEVPAARRSWSRALPYGFLLLNVVVGAIAFPRYGPYITQQGTWAEGAQQLESALSSEQPQRVTFPIPPYGAWKFDREISRR